MNDDELDRRLRAAGETWRSQHEPTEVGVPDGPRRRGWVVPVAAAASVALLAGGAVVVASQLDSDRSDAPPADATGDRWDPDLPPGVRPADVPGAVPPVNQPVQFPRAEAAGAFDPSPAAAAAAPRCRASDVQFGIERGEGPGEVSYRLEARDADTRCAIGRQPFQQYLRDGDHVEVLERTPDPRPGDWPGDVLVTSDSPAVLPTTWAGWCSPPPFDEVELFFDDGSVERLEVEGQVTGCDPDGLPERLRTTGWQPEDWSVEPPDSFAGLEARLVETVEGPGGLPTWVVELTSPRDLDFDTCPSWEVRQGGEESASWRLNCEGVPHERADGTPYLPAGEPVRFAIWTSYGDTDASLTWVLTTPDGPVTVDLSDGPAAPDGEPRLVPEDEANLHLLMSNQSFAQPDVRIALTIDGVELVDEGFAVEGQHSFEDFHVALPAGKHQVELTSDTGARLVRTITVPERGDRWAMATYWKETKRDDTGRFDWRLQDSPIGIA